jgi:hypothetical protein
VIYLYENRTRFGANRIFVGCFYRKIFKFKYLAGSGWLHRFLQVRITNYKLHTMHWLAEIIIYERVTCVPSLWESFRLVVITVGCNNSKTRDILAKVHLDTYQLILLL